MSVIHVMQRQCSKLAKGFSTHRDMLRFVPGACFFMAHAMPGEGGDTYLNLRLRRKWIHGAVRTRRLAISTT